MVLQNGGKIIGNKGDPIVWGHFWGENAMIFFEIKYMALLGFSMPRNVC
jgi:hypothetical protein